MSRPGAEAKPLTPTDKMLAGSGSSDLRIESATGRSRDTMLERFEPENPTETAIAEARAGMCSPGDLPGLLAGSRLFVSSRAEVAADGRGFEPLLLGEAGVPLVAAFTAPSRALLHRTRAEYLLEMDGDAFLRRLPPGYGTVVNPGYEAQFVVDAGAVERWRTGS